MKKRWFEGSNLAKTTDYEQTIHSCVSWANAGKSLEIAEISCTDHFALKNTLPQLC